MVSRSLVLLSCLAILSDLAASVETAAGASVFVLGDYGFAFSLNVPTNSDDLYFSLSGPDDRSWIAVGMGFQKMENSFMITAYGSSNGKNVTISPRISHGHEEPVWTSNSTIEVLAGSGFTNGSMVANGRCVNCRRWQDRALDLSSTTQNMIFATGPSGSIRSDSMTADTKAHNRYGVFTMDMQQASGEGMVPVIVDYFSSGAVLVSSSTYTDVPPNLHAAIMILTFVGIMPLGVIILRVINSVRWHAINQAIAATLAIIGGGLGIYIGTMYNRSKSFNTAHQFIGIVVCLGVVLQFVLGYMNHRVYKKTQTGTKMAPLHVWLGRIIIPAAIVTAFLGFPLALSPNYNWILVGLVIAVALGLFMVFLLRNRSDIRHPKNATTLASTPPPTGPDGYTLRLLS